ncbi:MAG: rod shape-determining protein MreC [Gracilibacteraceae bacterium]|jgi:rod shape-determining protein MreC|nr:rod shape-determining protein MreC [Gracilibacteraceae bacterium]
MKKRISPLVWAVIIFAAFFVILTAIRLSGAGAGLPNPVGGALRAALAPAERLIWICGEGLKNNFQALWRFREVQAENESLREQVETLTDENLRLKEDVLAALRYSDWQEVFENPVLADYEKIGAQVVMRNPVTWYRMLTLNRGSSDRVGVNDAVVGRLGLVGKVVAVTPTTADVMLLTDGDGQVAALTRDKNGTAVFGVVRGDYQQGSIFNMESALEMEFRREEPVETGEVVYTSGLGGIYPPGLPIGVVTDIQMGGAGMLQVAVIEPLADFAALEEVIIIKPAAN